MASGSGTISCDELSPAHGTTVTCALTPADGFYLSALTDNAAGVLGSAAGTWVKTYAIAGTDTLLVYGAPPKTTLLRSGTLLADVKLTGTAATANATVLFSYLSPTKYRYVRLRAGKVQVGQVGTVGGSPQPAGTVKATATYAAQLDTWYQLRLDLGALGEVGVSIRPRGSATWKKLIFSGAFKKFPSAANGGAGLGALKAASWFDNFSTWDPGRPPK